MKTQWRIQMFGGLRAERGRKTLERFRSQNIAALLAYLAYHTDQPHPREMLVDLLWPDEEPEAGRHNLRTALHWVRRYLEPSGVAAGSVVVADRLSVQLNPESVTTDAAQFKEAISLAARAERGEGRLQHLSRAVSLYQGELLPGFYQDWVLKEQRRLADQFFMACRRLTALHREAGNWEEAINCARRCVAVDPLREEAHQDLLRILVGAGQPAAALRHYEELRKILREELDEEPSDASRQLAQEIQRRMVEGEPLDLDTPPSLLTILIARADRSVAGGVDENSGAPSLVSCHGELLRDVAAEFPDAQPIVTHDNALAMGFARPSDAVRFALLVQSSLQNGSETTGHDTPLNIGMHLGEVGAGTGAEEDEAEDPFTTHLAIATRLTELASGGQILMTAGVFDSARPTLKNGELPGLGELRWLSHGPYLLAGFEEPCIVCEVGERGKAPLRQPPDCEAAKSIALSNTDVVLGWRPAVGQVVPSTDWVLREKLGEGGFGEVWRARHQVSNESRVFKFCFRADRLRNLKREMTLFRLLKDTLGDRRDIARLHNVQFEEAPYYLELEDTPGGNLTEWFERQGRCDNVPLEVRLDIVAQIATALAAAHSVGVIHKDVKPSNVLIEEANAGAGRPRVRVCLTDFGIGQLIDREALEGVGVTATGFAETTGAMTELSSRTGTRLYMAPELLAGKSPSLQSDIYSLGVLFYQLVVGDLSRPMTTDWERDVRDPLLREDLHRCIAGDPHERFTGAADVAEAIRALPQRRKRRQTKQGLSAAAALLALIALVAVTGMLFQSYRRRQAEAIAARETKLRGEAERQMYYSNVGYAASLIEERRYDKAREVLAACPKQFRHWEWGRLQYLCNMDMITIKGGEQRLYGVAFSPDGKNLATAGDDGTISVWCIESGKVLQKLDAGYSKSVAFSPDGSRIAAAYCDPMSRGVPNVTGHSARIWDLATGQPLQTLKGHKNQVESVRFAPDGRRVVTASSDKTARIWDAETGDGLVTLQGHRLNVSFADFSPDGDKVVTASYDETAKIWSVITGHTLRTLKGHKGRVVCAVFSPDGKYVATAGDDKTVKIWDAETGRETRVLKGHDKEVSGVVFSPNGQLLATTSGDLSIKMWNAKTGRELRTLEGHSAPISIPAFSPDGHSLATASHDGTLKVWSLDRKGEFIVLKGWHSTRGTTAEFSPDGKNVVMASDGDRRVRVWDAATGQGQSELKGPRIGITCATYSPDGARIIAGGRDGKVRIWDSKTGQELLHFVGADAPVFHLAASPDGKRIVTCAAYGDARLWEAQTGRPLGRLENLSDSVCRVSFSPDGEYFVSTAQRHEPPEIWNTATLTKAQVLQGHKNRVRSAAFSPDGSLVATASHDRTARIWGTSSGHNVLTLAGHSAPVESIGFSPDGHRVVTGCRDGTVRIWDALTGRELLTLEHHKDPVYSVAFSPDGRQLLTCGPDGAAILWNSLTWHDEDLPGDATMPRGRRIRLWKRNKWDEHMENLEAGSLPEMNLLMAERDAEAIFAQQDAELEAREHSREDCAEHLRVIHAALVRYRNEHEGRMPDWLSELVPEYLTTDTLLCPCDPDGVSDYCHDPKLPCSYSYQFSPYFMRSMKKTYAQWKTEQMREYGHNVATAKCCYHTLHLSYDGEVRWGGWETGVWQDYGTSDADTAEAVP